MLALHSPVNCLNHKGCEIEYYQEFDETIQVVFTQRLSFLEKMGFSKCSRSDRKKNSQILPLKTKKNEGQQN